MRLEVVAAPVRAAIWAGMTGSARLVRAARLILGLVGGEEGELPSGGEGESRARRGAWSSRQRDASALNDA